MAGPQLYERVHYRHDTRWLLEDGDSCLCLACVIEMMEDESVSVVRKKHMLSSFQKFLEKKSDAVYTFLGNDGRICAHFVGQMLGMLVNLEDDSALNLITEILVQLILGFKLEQFVHCILDGCLKELSAVTSMRLYLPILNFLGKLIDEMPSVAETIATDHYNLVEQLPQGLMYPHEGLKAAVCYLYGKLYSSSIATIKLADHFINKLCELFLATLENAQTKELQINCMGLLKQLLNFDQFVSVIMNASICNEDSENTPSLHAKMPLPLVLKKILLSKEEFLQIASTQCIAAVLVHFPAKYAPSFILADIPEFLFENLLSTSEVLIWSIYCCLILMTEERIFFTKCHTVYGIEAVLKSLKHVLQMNNMELQKQGLLLLTEILKRQPMEIKLFTSTGLFKAAIDVLQLAVENSVLEVAIEASKAVSSFIRKDHLSIPVQYGELEKLLSSMMEHCAELSLTPLRRKSSKIQPKKHDNKSTSRQRQFLTNVLESFHNACRLALDCEEYHIAHNNAFTAPSSKSSNNLQTFSLYLLNTCDNFCIPIVLRYSEWLSDPATMEIFFLLLTDMFAVGPNMKETFAVKLASASIIRLALETKSTLCSIQRNTNLNSACSNFLCHLCNIIWKVKLADETNSQKEVFDILKKSLIHIEGSTEGFIAILLESPNARTNREVLRCKQQALLIIACVAYLMEDRFVSETDLWWTVQSFLHSLQSHGDKVPLFVVRAALYLLARSQDKCEALNQKKDKAACEHCNGFTTSQHICQHFKGWISFQVPDMTGQILQRWLGSRDLMGILEGSGMHGGRGKVLLVELMKKVWARVKQLRGVGGISELSPIRNNHLLPEFFAMTGLRNWETHGVMRIGQLMEDKLCKSFQNLQQEFNIPRGWFYKYLQLRHALEVTLRKGCVIAQMETVHKLVLSTGGGKRGLISQVYALLLDKFLEEFPLLRMKKWEADLGGMSKDKWEDILEGVPSMSLSEQGKLSQLFIIHRVYKTPVFLKKVGVRSDDKCPKCMEDGADLLHMLWSCPVIGAYWDAVRNMINSKMSLQIQKDPKVCVLGYVSEIGGTESVKVAVGRLLYVARKLVAMRWIQGSPPTLEEFERKISVNIICKMLENVPEIQMVYFHHPLFLKLFFNYPQLMEKYGCLVMKCWIQEDCHEEEAKSSLVTKLHPTVQWTSVSLISILHDCPNAILTLLDLMNSGSVEVASKVLVILKAFLHGLDSFETSDLILNKLLQILQDTMISSDLQVLKYMGRKRSTSTTTPTPKELVDVMSQTKEIGSGSSPDQVEIQLKKITFKQI
ncbi:meiosis inhibitor protein 1 [Bufo gargarizans]|uniref:meiosis inhibitor protein 1 n=1 Tax=Bufo gargarizans TaxID=30331 RepID=UPI001CF1C565|nr:meiosis inhibitor protein 1 [Bufo gargarizans]